MSRGTRLAAAPAAIVLRALAIARVALVLCCCILTGGLVFVSAVASAESGSESSGSTEGPLTGCTSVETCRGPASPQPEFTPPPSETPGSSGPSSPPAPAPAPPATPATGGVALAGKNLSVRRTVALVRLNCLGDASCQGNLALTTRGPLRAKRHGRKAGTTAAVVAIGTASFTVAGDEAAVVDVKLSSTARALLASHHGRLAANLRIRERQPNAGQTQSLAVTLAKR